MASLIKLSINGKSHSIDVDEQTSLLVVLRDYLDLTGTKYGCGEGQCGACTVLIDGEARRSCITLVGSVAEKHVTTIEGLEKDGRLHPVQEAFLAEGTLQCGYCTSGMIIAACGLLRRNPHPAETEIVDFMQGNICRCGTYPRIIAAIQRASQGEKGGAR
jgi:aerobic-type carbon monoxide dehydrogenase small subunit (CoxS/CutS family)